MKDHTNQNTTEESRANAVQLQGNGLGQPLGFVDNRPEAIMQRKMVEMVRGSEQRKVIQRMTNVIQRVGEELTEQEKYVIYDFDPNNFDEFDLGNLGKYRIKDLTNFQGYYGAKYSTINFQENLSKDPKSIQTLVKEYEGYIKGAIDYFIIDNFDLNQLSQSEQGKIIDWSSKCLKKLKSDSSPLIQSPKNTNLKASLFSNGKFERPTKPVPNPQFGLQPDSDHEMARRESIDQMSLRSISSSDLTSEDGEFSKDNDLFANSSLANSSTDATPAPEIKTLLDSDKINELIPKGIKDLKDEHKIKKGLAKAGKTIVEKIPENFKRKPTDGEKETKEEEQALKDVKSAIDDIFKDAYTDFRYVKDKVMLFSNVNKAFSVKEETDALKGRIIDKERPKVNDAEVENYEKDNDQPAPWDEAFTKKAKESLEKKVNEIFVKKKEDVKDLAERAENSEITANILFDYIEVAYDKIEGFIKNKNLDEAKNWLKVANQYYIQLNLHRQMAKAERNQLREENIIPGLRKITIEAGKNAGIDLAKGAVSLGLWTSNPEVGLMGYKVKSSKSGQNQSV